MLIWPSAEVSLGARRTVPLQVRLGLGLFHRPSRLLLLRRQAALAQGHAPCKISRPLRDPPAQPVLNAALDPDSAPSAEMARQLSLAAAKAQATGRGCFWALSKVEVEHVYYHRARLQQDQK